ncbi:MAG: glycosyltransferase [Erysipelotrichaceae bacterium]|nr:glycosyltransferase [Erysipelotrichaceae bacterium]
MEKKIAVLVPCYNEELTVTKVVKDFQKALPEADIYVYNNNSTDKTRELAVSAGAIVRDEYAQGKGNVVRSMFRDIDADVYVMVDGDDTYPAEEVDKLIQPVLDGRADMVIGDRLSNGTYAKENKRGFHNFGNNLVRWLINTLFHAHINDIMTGYRAFSKKYVKSMPVLSDGFQIETEMTIFSLNYGMKIVELPIIYRDRPEGSFSKLNTFKDGFRVLLTIFNLLKDQRPLLFFSLVSILCLLLGLGITVPQIHAYLAAGAFANLRVTIFGFSLFLISLLSFVIGIVLDAIKNQTKFLFECHVNDIMKDINK